MKEPNPKDLKFDATETKKLQRLAKRTKKIKITINLDVESLEELKTISGKTGVPYQRLLNQMLKETLAGKKDTESRLERLERDIQKIKRELAA